MAGIMDNLRKWVGLFLKTALRGAQKKGACKKRHRLYWPT